MDGEDQETNRFGLGRPGNEQVWAGGARKLTCLGWGDTETNRFGLGRPGNEQVTEKKQDSKKTGFKTNQDSTKNQDSKKKQDSKRKKRVLDGEFIGDLTEASHVEEQQPQEQPKPARKRARGSRSMMRTVAPRPSVQDNVRARVVVGECPVACTRGRRPSHRSLTQ